MTLAKLPVGREGMITQVGGEGALRCRLLDMGLIPGTRVKVVKVAPMGDPVQLSVRGYELTIQLSDADEIRIEPVTELR